MANNNILTWLLLGGAAYVAYEWLTQPASSSGSSGESGPPPCPAPGVLSGSICTCPAPAVLSGSVCTCGSPNTLISGVCTAPPTYVPPSLTQQLQTLAGSGVTELNADQWNYYYSSPSPQGLAQPSPPTFSTIFFPEGRPPSGTAETTMTAAQFVNAIGNPGLSGFGNVGYKRLMRVPIIFSRQRGYGFGATQFTLGDLRRAWRA